MANVLGYNGGLTCALGVRDMDASLAWYRDILGMELVYRLDEMGWCELASPVARVKSTALRLRESDRGSAPKTARAPTRIPHRRQATLPSG